jgi:hypothetical protein
VACIWAITTLLLHGAHERIDDIAQHRSANDRLQSDARFRHQEAERLARVSQLRDGLVMRMRSVPLGLISLRSDLEEMALGAGVRVDTWDADGAQSSGNPIVCHLSAHGHPKGLLALLAAIDQHPFLEPRAMQLKVPPSAADAVLDVRFNLHYKINEPVDSDQATAAAAAATTEAAVQ